MKVFDKIVNNMECLELNLTKNCNYSCKYCFVDPSKEYEMDFDTISFLIDNYTKPEKNNYSCILFGGEPFLKIDIIKEFLEKYSNKFNNIIVLTNGSLLTKENALFLKTYSNKLSIQISIDGPEEQHDHFRVDNKGKGTFNRTLNGINILKEIDYPHWSLHATCSSYHIKYLYSIYEFLMKNEAINNLETIFNNIQIIHDCDEYSEENLDEFKREIKLIFDKFPDAKNYIKKHFYEKGETHTFCSAGYNYFSFFQNGDIAPCHRVYTDGKLPTIIGNFKTGEWYDNMYNIFNSRSFGSFNGIEKCVDCKSALCYPCYLSNYNNTKDFFMPPLPYCWFKKETDKFMREQLNIR